MYFFILHTHIYCVDVTASVVCFVDIFDINAINGERMQPAVRMIEGMMLSHEKNVNNAIIDPNISESRVYLNAVHKDILVFIPFGVTINVAFLPKNVTILVFIIIDARLAYVIILAK